MYITLDSLRNMARVKKNPNYSSHIVRQSMTEYEKQRDRNIEKNNRVLKELGLPFRKTNEHIRRRELIMEEEEDYTPNDDERVDAELEDVSYGNDNFTMHRPTLERQATLRKSSTGHKALASDERMHAQLDTPVRQVMRTQSLHSTQVYSIYSSNSVSFYLKATKGTEYDLCHMGYLALGLLDLLFT
ncbi:hypothetical protein Cgig2_023709 [Carnegiea gigantea]|uniref:Uncharacterized protein n=1 Tax=Carnegiea gigantea TaxID=171969 RepID=A0A9Q1QK78_9CARY|nr:hypothetical protein Cgig2_023709 [Carnegiea gigantea]